MPEKKMEPMLTRCVTIALEPPYEGPYDVEATGYELAGDGGVVVYLRLGMLYDFYRLQLACTLPASWDLWHLDSAVCYVDPERQAEGVSFDANLLLSVPARELRVVVHTPAGARTFAGAVILIETSDGGSRFEVTFRLTAASRLVFDRGGWAFHHEGEVIAHDAIRVELSALS